jgi:hypothetical protein
MPGRTTRSVFFVWNNEAGVSWREVIRDSARKEFEAAREEKDPVILARHRGY